MTGEKREHAVACPQCGLDTSRGYPVARRLTWNESGLCDEHEAAQTDGD